MDQLGGDADHDGVIDGARAPLDAVASRSSLRVRVAGADCDTANRGDWRVDGESVRVQADGECAWIVPDVAAGSHRLSLNGDALASNVVVGNRLIVSIGDSVASGEGNPDTRADLGRARWLHRPCHRSMRSGHAQAALAIERNDRATAVTFVALGCSGATVPRGLLGAYQGIEPAKDGRAEPPQVDLVNALAERRAVDALLVSVGANDIHFAKIVQFCAAVARCYERRFDPRTPREEAEDPSAPTLDAAIGAALGELRRRYAQLADALSPKVEAKRVLLVQYFDPTTGADGRFCSTHLGLGRIRPDESEWAHHRVIGRLNAAVAATAAEHGWTLVDGVGETFRGHGICSRDATARWVRTPAESFFRQDAQVRFTSIAGTLHPNGRGHQQTAALIRPRLAALLAAADRPDPPAGDDDENTLLGVGSTTAIIAGGLMFLGGLTSVAVFLWWRHGAREVTP